MSRYKLKLNMYFYLVHAKKVVFSYILVHTSTLNYFPQFSKKHPPRTEKNFPRNEVEDNTKEI